METETKNEDKGGLIHNGIYRDGYRDRRVHRDIHAHEVIDSDAT